MNDTVNTLRLNVVLVVENELQRNGFRCMIKCIDSAGSCTVRNSVQEALDMLPVDHPDLLILDLRALDERMVPSLQEAVTAGVKILLLVDSLNPEHITAAAGYPSEGFLCLNDLSGPILLEALNRVRTGEMSIPSRMARHLLNRVRHPLPAIGGTRTTMTPREHQVLRLMVDGLSNKQIARRLSISEHGVKRLVASILAKLNCANRTLAVARAIQEGICEETTQRT